MKNPIHKLPIYAIALSLSGLITLGESAMAASRDECSPPSWINDPDVPECPTSGSTLLPETAPAAAVVISRLKGWRLDPHTKKPVKGDEPLAQFVLDTLKAAGNKTPKIFLKGVDGDKVAEIKKQIDTHCADPKNECQTLKAQWQDALVMVPGQSFQWQQDYFQSTFDPATGLPVVRAVRNYSNGVNSKKELDQLVNASKELCISSGPPIPPDTEQGYSFDNGFMGGNIEGLPGGLCLHGNNQNWETFGQYYCGDKSNSVEIDVRWLAVGHADEVIGVVPDKTAKAPCDFALTWASPKKALDLMKAPKNKDQPFFEFFKDATFAEQLEFGGAQELCLKVQKLREKRGRAPAPATEKVPETSRGAALPTWLIRQFIRDAYAGSELVDEEAVDCKDIAAPTNSEVAEVLEKAGYNLLIQKKMESNQALVLNKLKERTGCSEIKVTPVPNLFFGGEPLEPYPSKMLSIDGKQRRYGDLSDSERERLPFEVRYLGIPKGRALGLLPNPTNAVPIGQTVIGPKPWNQAFRTYLHETYKQFGQDFKEADTWNANENMGNLHCSTNTLRVCRPASGKNRGSGAAP